MSPLVPDKRGSVPGIFICFSQYKPLVTFDKSIAGAADIPLAFLLIVLGAFGASAAEATSRLPD